MKILSGKLIVIGMGKTRNRNCIAHARICIYFCKRVRRFQRFDDGLSARETSHNIERDMEFPTRKYLDGGEGRRRLLVLQSDADFIQVPEQVGWVLIDPIGPCPLQLLPAIAPGEQSHRESECAARGQQIPNAVSDDDATAHANFQLLPCGDKQIGIGLREADVIARDDRHVPMECEQLGRMPCVVHTSARRDGMGHSMVRQRVQQFLRAGKHAQDED